MKELIGKCGFYCKACPTFISGNYLGCIAEHKEGDCFTRDCVIKKEISFCGECEKFPCDTILSKPNTTVLNKDWLLWKKNSTTNR